MRVVYERCCGLDVHKASVVACLLTPDGTQVRTVKTLTADLLGLVDWLTAAGCTHVAMESTGVYWKPIYNLLEGNGMTLLVVNARHMKAVPGRKTDVKDAEWIADLLRHGLLTPSFIPDRPQRELAELLRYRRSLIEERVREVNRIQKVLEGANIKLAGTITNVLGVGGRAVLDAVVAGIQEPAELAGRVSTHVRASREELEAALTGRIGAHQRAMLSVQLRHIDFLDAEVAGLDAAIAERMRPFGDALDRLDEIPGVGVRTAQEILAAIGTDMSRFPTHRHLASWARLCPGTHQSAGKRSPASTGKNNAPLRQALVEAANAVSCSRKQSYLLAQYRRLAARRGRKRAIVAVAHSILVIAYYLLRDGTRYTDLGPLYFDQRDRDQVVRRAVKRLEALHLKVTVEPAA
jgi:transposase